MPNIAAPSITSAPFSLEGKAAVATIDAWLERALHCRRPAAVAAADAHGCRAGDELKIWIHLCPPSVWQQQLALLQSRLAEQSDRQALLKRYPLLGVPFAVKDNIDIAGEPTTAACPASAASPTAAPRWCSVCSMPGPCG
jgi:Asp-tRNA(Asn)/Glu-tRNA(Gln) amidotransferase A subunit family amidase